MKTTTGQAFVKTLHMHGVRNVVGTDLNLDVNYARVAEGCGLKGVRVTSVQQLTDVQDTAVKEQMNDNVTTFIEVALNQTPGDAFRRDAMTKPVRFAGIDAADRRDQQIA